MKNETLSLKSFHPCRIKMEQAGLATWQIERFGLDFESLCQGRQGIILERELQPLRDVPSLGQLDCQPRASDVAKVAVIKLNGGLGTSMGLDCPKGLLPIRDGLSFLDLTRLQVENLRQSVPGGGGQLPLILMNSFHTQAESLAQLGPWSNGSLPLDFLQSKVPKLNQDDLLPAQCPAHPELEWCPPGHGEIYAALRGSGLLQQLLEASIGYAFVSNIDNLGATLDLRLLRWFIDSQLDLVMEVTARTPQDKKGGHLASDQQGRLLLRERAQCQASDLTAFEDIERHRYFNTNNLWLNLAAIQSQPLPRLPLIVNRKTIDPTDSGSRPVFQLESAMGAAISAFLKTQVLEVPRQRFLPVKTLSDLLILRSDCYRLGPDYRLEGCCDALPQVQLDPQFFATYAQFCHHFQVIPGLKHCRTLRVDGDVHFLQAMDLRGQVHLSAGEKGLNCVEFSS